MRERWGSGAVQSRVGCCCPTLCQTCSSDLRIPQNPRGHARPLTAGGDVLEGHAHRQLGAQPAVQLPAAQKCNERTAAQLCELTL